METSLIEMKLKKLLPHLSKKEQIIAEYILKDPHAIVHHSISEVADSIGMAESTIFRFCKKIGYNGYQDLKIALATGAIKQTDTVHSDMSDEDSYFEIAKKTFQAAIKSINDTFKFIKEEDIAKAIAILDQSKTVAFFGYGASGIVALDAYEKFIRTSLCCIHSFDKHTQLMQITHLGIQDCAVIISHTGMSKDTLEICRAVKEQNVKIIAITGYPLSRLAKDADVCLISVSEEVTYESQALAARISQLSLIDALFINYCMENSDSSYTSLQNIRKVSAKTKFENHT